VAGGSEPGFQGHRKGRTTAPPRPRSISSRRRLSRTCTGLKTQLLPQMRMPASQWGHWSQAWNLRQWAHGESPCRGCQVQHPQGQVQLFTRSVTCPQEKHSTSWNRLRSTRQGRELTRNVTRYPTRARKKNPLVPGLADSWPQSILNRATPTTEPWMASLRQMRFDLSVV
jgi:hypothetical protein